MRILILGGTQFVGRHIAREASDAGHEVTLFNRGSQPAVLPHLERIHGDRDGGLSGLHGTAFDAVVDVNGYLPRLVRDAAALLEPLVAWYLFISTISVYADIHEPHADEDHPLAQAPQPLTEEISAGNYGPLKAGCEQVVTEVFSPERRTIVRPGLVVGRFDPTDRFTYWVRRVARGGEVLAPGSAADPLQWVDVRDLARFCVHLLERGVTGVFNAVSPPDSVTMGELLTVAERVSAAAGGPGTRAPATVTWVDPDFLAAREVRPWADLPAWLPAGENQMLRLSSQRAAHAGLETSPLDDTVADVLAWDAERGAPPLKAGLSGEREAELLGQWRLRGAV